MLFAGARRTFAAAANGGFARLALRGLSAVSSSAANVAPRRLSSNDVHVVEKFKNGEFEWYKQAQHALTKVAPRNGVGFVALRGEPRRMVYRDITPSFELLGAFETQAFVTFLRGRRWGKTVMLDVWVTFVRRRKGESGGATSATPAARAQAAADPFEGTSAHHVHRRQAGHVRQEHILLLR